MKLLVPLAWLVCAAAGRHHAPPSNCTSNAPRHNSHAQCNDVSWRVDRQMALLRAKLMADFLSARNASQHLERALLLQSAKNAEFAIADEDMKMDIVAMKGEHDRLWESAARGGRRGVMLATEGGRGGELADRLRNGIGDLKAEWVLIKRQVLAMKDAEAEQRVWRSDARTAAAKTDDDVQALKDKHIALEDRLDELAATSGVIKSQLDAVQRAMTRGGDGHALVKSQLSDLRFKVSTVSRRIDQLARANRTASLRGRSTDWRRDTSTSRMPHDAAGNSQDMLPKGTPAAVVFHKSLYWTTTSGLLKQHMFLQNL